MPSETSICNLALVKIGVPRINALADSTTQARHCSEVYEQCRDEVLSLHDWNFAAKRATLSQLADAPSFGWDYQYTLPTDCLRVRQLNAFEEQEARPQWEVENGCLLTDQDEANIRYTFRQTDASKFSALFIDALSLKIASRICAPLTGSRSMVEDLVREFEALGIAKAARNDSSEGRPKIKQPWVESAFVRSREFGTDLPPTFYT